VRAKGLRVWAGVAGVGWVGSGVGVLKTGVGVGGSGDGVSRSCGVWAGGMGVCKGVEGLSLCARAHKHACLRSLLRCTVGMGHAL
jgi:hypothetical protein